MKSLVFFICFICSFNFVLANTTEPLEKSIITEIDDYEYPENYIEVSEEGLPQSHYQQLLQLMNSFRFTLLPEANVRSIFETLKKDSRARQRSPGGQCSFRRAYIQSYLKKRNIVSGKLVMKCPANNGRMRLRDRVSGRYYSYSNFHDANIVAINNNSFMVMDVQFEDAPVSLHAYLTEIEASQRFRPLKRKGSGSTRGLCYWSITTPHLSY